MPDTQISEEMVDAFIATFNSGVFDKAPFGMPIDERCRCKKCLQEEADARSTVRAALEAALAGHVVGWRTMDSAPNDGTPILGYSTEGVMYVCWSYKESWVFFENHRGDRWHFYPTHWKPLPAPPVPVEPNQDAGAS